MAYITQNYAITQAIARIKADYGDTVSVVAKKKTLRKFGENENVGTSRTTIMNLQGSETNETHVSTNAITHFASSASGDTSRSLTVEGHTISGGNLTFVTQTVTTNGSNWQTKTALTTPLARVTRAYNSGTSTQLTGNIYFAEDVTFTSGVPSPNSAIHLTIKAGEQQSQKASTSISSADYFLIVDMTAGVLEKTSSWAQVRLEAKSASSSVWLPLTQYVSISDTSGMISIMFPEIVIVPKNHDVRLSAIANTSGVHVVGGFQGYLASVQ